MFIVTHSLKTQTLTVQKVVGAIHILTPVNLIYKFPLTRVQRFLSMVILGLNKLTVGVNITEVLEVRI